MLQFLQAALFCTVDAAKAAASTGIPEMLQTISILTAVVYHLVKTRQDSNSSSYKQTDRNRDDCSAVNITAIAKKHGIEPVRPP